MSSFIKADVRQTSDYGASFSHFLFDTLSKLADRSSEQVRRLEEQLTGHVVDRSSEQVRRLHTETVLEFGWLSNFWCLKNRAGHETISSFATTRQLNRAFVTRKNTKNVKESEWCNQNEYRHIAIINHCVGLKTWSRCRGRLSLAQHCIKILKQNELCLCLQKITTLGHMTC